MKNRSITPPLTGQLPYLRKIFKDQDVTPILLPLITFFILLLILHHLILTIFISLHFFLFENIQETSLWMYQNEWNLILLSKNSTVILLIFNLFQLKNVSLFRYLKQEFSNFSELYLKSKDHLFISGRLPYLFLITILLFFPLFFPICFNLSREKASILMKISPLLISKIADLPSLKIFLSNSFSEFYSLFFFYLPEMALFHTLFKLSPYKSPSETAPLSWKVVLFLIILYNFVLQILIPHPRPNEFTFWATLHFAILFTLYWKQLKTPLPLFIIYLLLFSSPLFSYITLSPQMNFIHSFETWRDFKFLKNLFFHKNDSVIIFLFWFLSYSLLLSHKVKKN